MDTSLRKIMIGLFGISGMAVMLIAWLRPAAGGDRVLSTVIGVIGISVAVVLVILLRNKADSITAKAEITRERQG